MLLQLLLLSPPTALASAMEGVRKGQTPAKAENDGGDGYWCKAVDFQQRELFAGLSNTTAQIRSQFRDTCAVGSRANDSQCRRVAVLIRGEAYRTGGQYSRNGCTRARVNETIIALASIRARVIGHLEAIGFAVHTFAQTYMCAQDPKRDRLLETFLQPQLRGADFVKSKDKWNQAMLLQVGLRMVMDFALEHNITYDGILVLRFDAVIVATDVPANMTSLHKPVNTFLFPFLGIGGKYRLTDCLFWIPWPALPCLLQVMHNSALCFNPRAKNAGSWGSSGHGCYLPLLKEFKVSASTGQTKPEDRLGLMVPGRFNSNTGSPQNKNKDNQLYLLVPRSTPRVLVFLKTATDVATEVHKGNAIWKQLNQQDKQQR